MTNVEMTCLQGLADLERLEGPWLDGLATGDPEVAAITMRLLMAHLAWNSKRLLGAMVQGIGDYQVRFLVIDTIKSLLCSTPKKYDVHSDYVYEGFSGSFLSKIRPAVNVGGVIIGNSTR